MSKVYEQPVHVPQVEALSLGMVLRYSVWANKSLQGDFGPEFADIDSAPDTFWTVEARIKGARKVEGAENHHREILVGRRAVFNVFATGSYDSLQKSEAIILPRQAADGMTVDELGEFPIQEGYATRLHDFRVDGEPVNGRLVIPSRNIQPETLRVISPGFSN